MADSISVHVKITVDPSKIDEFITAFRPTFEHVVAEPLNTFIELCRDEKTPGVFTLVENWNASADYMMNVQIKKDYYQPYQAVLQTMLLKAPEVEIVSRMPGNEFVSVRKEAFPER